MILDIEKNSIVKKVVEAYERPIERREGGDAVISVQAVAGAGKSVLIIDITKRLSNASYLFLCHTDNIADRARSTLPSNVSVRTFSQAAHDFVCKTHSEKAVVGTSLPRGLSNYELVKATDGLATGNDAYKIRQILDVFYKSGSPNVELHHVHAVLGKNAKKVDVNSLLGFSRDIWGSQKRRAADTAPLTEQSAIKLWTLGRNFFNYNADERYEGGTSRRISPLGDADICIVEEAQDLYESIIEFLGRQRCVVIMFSDDMQSLDQNAPFRRLDHNLLNRGHGFTINSSYRYGGELPAVLTCLREKEGGTDVVPTTGKGKTSIYKNLPSVLSEWLDAGLPFTAIAANPTSLYEMSLMYSDATVGWVNGLQSSEYHFEIIFSLICLATEFSSYKHADQPRSYITVGWLKKFSNLEEVYDHFQRIGDQRYCKLCEWIWGVEVYELFEHFLQLRDNDIQYQEKLLTQRNCDAPDITFSSVRAAKGHEWPLIVVSNDMIKSGVIGSWTAPDANTKCAIRWIYTAVSRAQYGVALPEPLLEHLAEYGHLIDIDAKIPCLPNAEVFHPDLGVERHRRLEMLPENRAKRQEHILSLQKNVEKSNRSSRQSEQLLIKEKILRDADSLSSEVKNPKDYLDIMRSR